MERLQKVKLIAHISVLQVPNMVRLTYAIFECAQIIHLRNKHHLNKEIKMTVFVTLEIVSVQLEYKDSYFLKK